MIPVAYTESEVQSFLSKVERSAPDLCWLWTAEMSRDGYGRFRYNGQELPAHRVAWEIAYGYGMPKEFFACHMCDNPACCNPLHIWPGTPRQNRYDADRKARSGVTIRTHCPRGHEYTEDNVAYRDGKGRHCKRCVEEWRAEHPDKMADYRRSYESANSVERNRAKELRRSARLKSDPEYRERYNARRRAMEARRRAKESA